MRRNRARSRGWSSSKSMSTCRNILTKPSGSTASPNRIAECWVRRVPAAREGGGDRAGDRPGRETQDGPGRAPPDPESIRSGFRAAAGLSRGDAAPAEYDLAFDVCHFHCRRPTRCTMMRHVPTCPSSRPHRQARDQGRAPRSVAAHIREMAALPNVVCKLSGVTTEADYDAWTRDQLRPVHRSRDRVLRPGRISTAAHWPSRSSRELSAMARRRSIKATAGFSPADKRKLFANAVKTYRLGA